IFRVRKITTLLRQIFVEFWRCASENARCTSGNRHSFAASGRGSPRHPRATFVRNSAYCQKRRIRESSGCMFPQLHVPRTREKSDFFGNFTPKNPKKLVDSPI